MRIAVPLVGTVAQGYIYSVTPSNLQGRVASLMSVLETGLSALVPLTVGPSVQAGQVGPSYGLGLAATLAALAAVSAGGLRSLGTPSTWNRD